MDIFRSLCILGLICCYIFGRAHSVKLGDSCNRHTSCNHEPEDRIANSKCEAGTCVCANGYYGEAGQSRCIKGHLGDACDEKTDNSTFCSTGDEHSICDTSTNSCACDRGYTAQGQPAAICTPVGPGTTCTADATGDALCQTGIANGYCSTVSNQCSCPGGNVRRVYVKSLKACAVEMFSDPCNTCRDTGGLCYDADEDGLADGCECPAYKPSSTNETLAVGCDQGLAEVGQVCGVGLGDSVECRPDNALCRPATNLFGRWECTCEPGYIMQWSTSGADFRRKSECYRHVSRVTDPNCATCERNNGKCYDVDGDDLRDGCECPDSRSTTDPDDPTKDCEIVHLTVECKKEAMRVCYAPHNNTLYPDIGDRLAQGSSYVYVRNHLGVDPCIFEKMGEDWCLDLSLEADGYEVCGTRVSFPTHSMVSYQNYIAIQWDRQVPSRADINYHVYCQYDTRVNTVASGAEITGFVHQASEGKEIHPDLKLDVFDQFGNDATKISVGLGEPVSLRVTMTDNKQVYGAIRVEVCIASNQPELSIPDGSTFLLISDGCPTENGYITNRNRFKRENSFQVVSSGEFPMFSFPDSNDVFFHCAVSVCRGKDDCNQRLCTSRKRRSEDTKHVLEKQKRALVDSTGRINDNLLKNLRTGSVKVRTSTDEGDPWAYDADDSENEGEGGIFESEDTIMIVGVVGGVVLIIIIVVIVLVCCCGREKKKKPSRSSHPRMMYPPWYPNPYQQIPNPYTQAPMSNPFMQMQTPFNNLNPFQQMPMINPMQQNPLVQTQAACPQQEACGQVSIPNHTSILNQASGGQNQSSQQIQTLLQQLKTPVLSQQLQVQDMLQQLQAQNVLQKLQSPNSLQAPPNSLQEMVSSALTSALRNATVREPDAVTAIGRDKGRRHSVTRSHRPPEDDAFSVQSSFVSVSTIHPFHQMTQTTGLTGHHTTSDFKIPRPQITLPKLFF